MFVCCHSLMNKRIHCSNICMNLESVIVVETRISRFEIRASPNRRQIERRPHVLPLANKYSITFPGSRPLPSRPSHLAGSPLKCNCKPNESSPRSLLPLLARPRCHIWRNIAQLGDFLDMLPAIIILLWRLILGYSFVVISGRLGTFRRHTFFAV